MMKKQGFKLLLVCFVCLLAASCTSIGAEQPQEAQSPVGAIVEQNTGSESVKIDVDLTTLSSTMIYAEIFNIMTNPDSYAGKTIRGIGVYDNYYNEEMDRYFHYFVILDATGCCPQGLDIVLNGEHIYPDDYPEIGENIEVVGIFIKDKIEEQSYYYLAVDNIIVLD